LLGYGAEYADRCGLSGSPNRLCLSPPSECGCDVGQDRFDDVRVVLDPQLIRGAPGVAGEV
jgi:hypothetical protein